MVDFFSKSEVQLLLHLPYSPDRSLCDFLLFPEVKKQLKGTHFESAEDACRTFTRAVEDVPKSTWDEEQNELFHCMAMCIAAEGRFLKKWRNSFFLLSPISNEYPETFGASKFSHSIKCFLTHMKDVNLCNDQWWASGVAGWRACHLDDSLVWQKL